MSKKYDNRTLNDKVSLAIKDAERLLSSPSKMLDELAEKNDFEYNSGAGHTVIRKINNCSKIAKVFLWKPYNPFTKAMGYSDGIDVHINSRKIGYFDHADLVGLLVHEWLHLAGFGHGNNYKTEHKCKYSVNYFCSENIGKWL